MKHGLLRYENTRTDRANRKTENRKAPKEVNRPRLYGQHKKAPM